MYFFFLLLNAKLKVKVCNSILSCLFDLKCTEEVYRGKSVPKQKLTLHRDTVSYIICSETQCSSKDLFEGKGLVNIKKTQHFSIQCSKVEQPAHSKTLKETLTSAPYYQQEQASYAQSQTIQEQIEKHETRASATGNGRGTKRKKIKTGTAMRKVRTNPGPQTLETGQQSGSFA